MSWSAAQYVAFEAERTRPARDLLAAVPATHVEVAVDLGCGPGNSTGLIAARFPRARITGIDSSADMIAAARARLPTVQFELGDVASWAAQSAAPADLIFANAVLQWVHGHERIFPALVNRLVAGGFLAVQIPDNLSEPAQTLMRDIAEDPRWRRRLASADSSRVVIESAQRYYAWLKPSCSHVEVWRTTYHHVLPGAEAVVEWFKGTGLLPFLAPLDAAERTLYLERYSESIRAAYPAAADGSVWLPFPRLFILACR